MPSGSQVKVELPIENGERVLVSSRYIGEPNRWVSGLYEMKTYPRAGNRHIVHTASGSFDVPIDAIRRPNVPLDRMAALQAVTSVMANHTRVYRTDKCSCGETINTDGDFNLHLLVTAYEEGRRDG